MGTTDAAKILGAYQREIRIKRGLHSATVAERLRYLEDWIGFLALRSRDLWSSTRDDALDWWETITRRYDPNTRAKVLTSLNSFYEWASLEFEAPPPHWFQGYRARRVDSYVRPHLSRREVERVLNLPLGNRPVQIRNKALWLFLVSTGARISSVLAVNLSDLHPEQQMVWFRRVKGDNPYWGTLLPEVWRFLRFYIENARPVLIKAPRYGPIRDEESLRRRVHSGTSRPDEALWIGQGGGRLNRESARQAIIGISNEAGLATPVTPHGLRHTAATLLYEAGASDVTIKEFLGHKDIRSTHRYTHYKHKKELKKAAEIHPVRKIMRARKRLARRTAI